MNPHDIVFLSASVPNRPEWVADSKPIEIEEAVICLARAVFARGGRLLFGGHPSISPLIAAVAGEYFPVDPTRQIRPVITFQSKFFRDNLPNETWELYRMGWASIEWTPEEMRNGLPDRDESLNAMRRRMLLDPTLIDADREMQAAVQRNLLGPPKAMVAIGGMEGIADEAAMFLDFRSQWEAGKIAPTIVPPLFTFTSGGGAAARLLEPPADFFSRLWPRLSNDRTKRAKDLTLLQQARIANQIVPVESEFQRELAERAIVPVIEGDATEFEPYAAIAQWLVERVGIS